MSLREDLLAIPGIAGAELEGDVATPAGVRIRLAPGADSEIVGREVQQVLAAHGMRSHMTEAPSPAAGQAHLEQSAGEAPVDSSVQAPVGDDRLRQVPPVAVSTTGPDAPPPPPGALRAAVGGEVVQMPGVVARVDAAAEAALDPVGAEGLAAVGVEETRSGVTVRVSTETGRHAERSVAGAGPMVDVAIVEAVGELLVSPAPSVVAVNDHLVDGTEVVLVVVEHANGSRSAGSAVMDVGRPFAVGTAAWRAVSELV